MDNQNSSNQQNSLNSQIPPQNPLNPPAPNPFSTDQTIPPPTFPQSPQPAFSQPSQTIDTPTSLSPFALDQKPAHEDLAQRAPQPFPSASEPPKQADTPSMPPSSQPSLEPNPFQQSTSASQSSLDINLPLSQPKDTPNPFQPSAGTPSTWPTSTSSSESNLTLNPQLPASQNQPVSSWEPQPLQLSPQSPNATQPLAPSPFDQLPFQSFSNSLPSPEPNFNPNLNAPQFDPATLEPAKETASFPPQTHPSEPQTTPQFPPEQNQAQQSQFESFPQADSVPTDLSHLISGNASGNIPQPLTNQPSVSVPENLVVQQPNGNPEVPNIPTSDSHRGIPKWLIGVGVGLLLIVIGASAFFILGIGQSPKTTSLPATQSPKPTTQPANPAATPASSPSGGFGQLEGSPSATSTPQSATSAAELLNQRR